MPSRYSTGTRGCRVISDRFISDMLRSLRLNAINCRFWSSWISTGHLTYNRKGQRNASLVYMSGDCPSSLLFFIVKKSRDAEEREQRREKLCLLRKSQRGNIHAVEIIHVDFWNRVSFVENIKLLALLLPGYSEYICDLTIYVKNHDLT